MSWNETGNNIGAGFKIGCGKNAMIALAAVLAALAWLVRA